MKKMKGKNQNPVNDKTASKIAGWMLGVQTKFAIIMNKTFQHTTISKMKIILVLFCIISGGLSVYYFYDAIVSNKKKNDPVTIEGFVVPRSSIDREVEAMPNVYVDEDTWSKVQSFKLYMDSIKTVAPKEYNKIMYERPGLMDSIKQLEELYYSQKIK